MLFSEPVFIFLFLPVLFLVYALAPRAARNTLLRLQGKDDCTTVTDNVRPIDGFAAQLGRDPNSHRGKVFKAMRSRRADAQAGRLLMLHDSFAPPLMPFLAEHFREGLFIWTDDDSVLPQEARDFRPDVVIEEVVERRLSGTEPDLLKTPRAAPNETP